MFLTAQQPHEMRMYRNQWPEFQNDKIWTWKCFLKTLVWNETWKLFVIFQESRQLLDLNIRRNWYSRCVDTRWSIFNGVLQYFRLWQYENWLGGAVLNFVLKLSKRHELSIVNHDAVYCSWHLHNYVDCFSCIHHTL